MKKKLSFFQHTKILKEKFNTFLMNITTAGIVFNQALVLYLKKQDNKAFMELKNRVSQLEGENDALRREIESDLYRQMLLPGMRSDILDLMEGCDRVINQYEKTVELWSVEHPKIPPDFFEETTLLAHITLDCVSALMSGVQAFLNGQVDIEEEIQECYFLEHKVDEIAVSLKRKVFEKKLVLARQLQLKEFVTLLEQISDLAEDAADKLKIISVKHAL